MKQSKSARVMVIIPARNEEETIGQVVAEVRRQNFSVLVVNDGSTDSTEAVARSAGAHVVTLVYPLGVWGAIQTGLRYAHYRGYDVAITMDADGQHIPEFLEDLLRPVEDGFADVAVGVYPDRLSVARLLAVRFFRKVAGVSFIDVTSGMRVYGKKAIELLVDEKVAGIEYQDLGVLLLLIENGLKVAEVPVRMERRVSGKSRLFSSWFVVGSYLLYTGTLALGKTRIINARIKE
ncbi:MAG: glycosyltransferase family 2 protein [Deltaproteobacteria bacterium]|nr:glycosyltransferase family 2 protein [Deltaproteobacteria bacterium]MBW2069463.1 glycosyltransferase family 2 protein [Deltaproteobacteria bacterium]